MTKSIKLFAMLAMASLAMFTSCQNDDPDPIIPEGPVVTFSGVEGTSLAVNFADHENHTFSISFTVEVDAPGGIAEFKMIRTKLLDGSNVDEDVFDYTAEYLDETSANYAFTGDLDFLHFVNENFNAVDFQFIVIDNNDKVGELIFTVTDATVFPQTKEGYFYHVQGPDHGAYNLDGDATVAATGEATDKSLISTDGIGEPFTGKWTTGNNTLFQKVDYNFDNGLVREARLLFSTQSASAAVDAPAVNDIYVAQKGDLLYVLKITSIDPEAIPPSGTADTQHKGKITFSYKKY